MRKHDQRCALDGRSFDEYMKIVAEDIARHGLHLVGVFSDTGDEPPFTYTVGLLPTLGFELLVYGLPHEVAMVVLNDIGAHVRAGRGLHIDVPTTQFTNLPIKFMICGEKAQEVNGVARRFHQSKVPMVQLVLCDRAGKFPGEAGFDHAYMDHMQPLL
jgi:hypothetical protein